MKISLGVVTAMPLDVSISLSKAAESAGFYRIFVGEDIFHRELFTYLSIISLNTKSIGVATGITSPYVRNAQIIANSSLAVSGLSGGRFTLGLGTGGLPEVEKLTGERPKKPVEVLENSARMLKNRHELEIFFGVRGPKMLELAGRVADGVILSGPKTYIKKAVEIVDAASKGRKNVKKVLWNAFYLGENPAIVSKVTSVMLESMPPFALKYVDRSGAEEELCLYGSEETVREQIEEFKEIGIDEFVIGPPYGREPEKVIKAFM